MREDTYEWVASMQSVDWWFRGRKRVVEAYMRRKVGVLDGSLRVLDIGSGFGAMVPLLRCFGKVHAIEPYKPAREALKQCGVEQVLEVDFPGKFNGPRYDLVTMFDVLEHIDDDSRALEMACASLLDHRGKIIVTVPACQWLYCQHDITYGHRRRYSKRGLLNLLRDAGFCNVAGSYFMTILFPIAAPRRFLLRFRTSSETDSPVLPPVLNAFCEGVFSMEAALVSRLSLPYGLSVIAYGEKRT